MEAVEFHTGIDDPASFTVRMLRKAYGQGTRVLVTAPASLLEQLSRLLWQEHEDEFLPHVFAARSNPGQLARTPIWLAAAVTAAEHEPRVLINVGAAAPDDPARLDRLIEVVSADADQANQGRQRWRFYKAAGWKLEHLTGRTAA